jgi:hypothetical protein
MLLVGILLGFITAVGIVYVSILQRQSMEDQRKQIAILDELVGNLQRLVKQGVGS